MNKRTKLPDEFLFLGNPNFPFNQTVSGKKEKCEAPDFAANPCLWEKAREKIQKKEGYSLYANTRIDDEYEKMGGKYKKGSKKSKGKGVEDWFKEDWVDIRRPKKDGDFYPCGRKSADPDKYKNYLSFIASYPKCLPLKKAKTLSAKEREYAILNKEVKMLEKRWMPGDKAVSARTKPPKKKNITAEIKKLKTKKKKLTAQIKKENIKWPPQKTVAGYIADKAFKEDAAKTIEYYEVMPFEVVHAAWLSILPKNSINILDVGAGSGRDAATLSEMGHNVTAVEPSSEMLNYAKLLHSDENIKWIKDFLPNLSRVYGKYDLILLSAVWMFITEQESDIAFDRLIELLNDSGYIIFLLRHGPSEKTMRDVPDEEVKKQAKNRGLKLITEKNSIDIQGRKNVFWTTLIFKR